MGNGMNKVLPGLYVGNYRDSKDANQLNKNNITHILAIHDTARRLHSADKIGYILSKILSEEKNVKENVWIFMSQTQLYRVDFSAYEVLPLNIALLHSDKHYLCVMASDSPNQNLTQYFSLCNDFIHAARLRDGNVLIHCLAGMSRSVTVAVAYIMSVTNLSWKEALKVVRAGRAVANPNLGFQKQLQEFETTRLIEERRRLKERYPSLALVHQDAEQCALMLNNYEELLSSRTICEGRCALGEQCPTGLCRQPTQRRSRRRTSRSQPERSLSRSPSTTSVRPRSGPAGLHSYTGSAPPSRTGSRVDLHMLNTGTLTAPATPQPSPPVSPKRRGTIPSVPLPLKEDLSFFSERPKMIAKKHPSINMSQSYFFTFTTAFVFVDNESEYLH